MKVLVLLGGDSPEREISLWSGRTVIDALNASDYEVVQYDPVDGFSGLDRYMGAVNVVLPILHGAGGEDGSVQKELEKRGFKYLGSDSNVSALCFDKVRVKEILNKLSILSPKWQVVDKEAFLKSELIERKYVLKPIGGGSSLDTFIIRDKSSINLNIFDKYSHMLLEELIEGIEITVPVLDKSALPVVEIIPPDGKNFDYENKYNGESQELCPALHVSQNLQKDAQQLAERIHVHLGLRHLSRTDIIIDKYGKLWFLEVNTMPGLTNQSLFPKSAQVAGLSMTELAKRLVQLAIG